MGEKLNGTLFRRREGGHARLAVLAWLVLPATAFGGDSGADAADAKTLDQVKVTAAKLAPAIAAKLDAQGVVDSVSLDDARRYGTDDSVASMLTMAPGVSAVMDENIPRYLTVRGIQPDLNQTTIDGLTLASAGDSGSGTRRANLQMLPGELASRIDVYKTFTAEQSPDGIGADIDIVTQSAFKQPGNLSIDTYGNYSDKRNDSGHNAYHDTHSPWGGGAKFNYATRFGPGQQFGLVMSARYQSVENNISKRYQSTKYYYTSAGRYLSTPSYAAGWNGLAAPYNFDYYADDNRMKTFGGSAKLEWKPTDGGFYGSLLFYSYGFQRSLTEDGYDISSNKSIEDQTAAGGRIGIKYLNDYWKDTQWNNNNRGIQAHLQWQGDDSLLSLRAGYSRDRVDIDNPYLKAYATLSGNNYLSYAAGDSDGMPYVTGIDDPGVLQSANYKLSDATDTRTHAVEGVSDIRLDFAKNIQPDARGFGYALGAESRWLDISKDVEETVYATGSPSAHSLFYDPDYRYPGSSYTLPFIDYKRFLAGGGWSNFAIDEADSAYDSGASDYTYKEQVRDAYASLHYATADTLAILGVRYDNTRFTAYTPQIESGELTSRKDINQGGYHKPLPSLSVQHRIDDADLLLKGSISRTVGRPTPADIATAEDRDCSDDTDVGCTITRGNPDLKPRRSLNMDASMEKYFDDEQGMLSLAWFKKKIQDDIINVQSQLQEADGSVDTVNEPQNADSSSMHGLEFSYVQNGLQLGGQRVDVMFNATRLTGHMSYTSSDGVRGVDQLLYQPRVVANLGLTYHLPWRRSALSFLTTYSGSYLTSVGSQPWNDVGVRHRAVSNLSYRASLSEHASLKLDVGNIFAKGVFATIGPNYRYLRNINSYGRSYTLHLIYRL